MQEFFLNKSTMPTVIIDNIKAEAKFWVLAGVKPTKNIARYKI